jgi:hypothetical protein
MIIRFSISTGAGNTATPNLTKFCTGNLINHLSAENLQYPVQYDALYSLTLGQSLAGLNGLDCPKFADKVTPTIDSLRQDYPTYTNLAIGQSSLRVPAYEFLVLLRDICREHPACFVYFY